MSQKKLKGRPRTMGSTRSQSETAGFSSPRFSVDKPVQTGAGHKIGRGPTYAPAAPQRRPKVERSSPAIRLGNRQAGTTLSFWRPPTTCCKMS